MDRSEARTVAASRGETISDDTGKSDHADPDDTSSLAANGDDPKLRKAGRDVLAAAATGEALVRIASVEQSEMLAKAAGGRCRYSSVASAR